MYWDFQKLLTSQGPIKLFCIFKHASTFEDLLQKPWSLCPLHTTPLIIRAEHFAVINGFYPWETRKRSHNLDSRRTVCVTHLEAFPAPHRESGKKPTSELTLLVSIHCSTWSPLPRSWKGPDWEQTGWRFDALLSALPHCLAPSLIILVLVLICTILSRTWLGPQESHLSRCGAEVIATSLLRNRNCNASFVFDGTS